MSRPASCAGAPDIHRVISRSPKPRARELHDAILEEYRRRGLPEPSLGIIPGAGGTQRLGRALGKARAMEAILTGRSIDAREADRLGMVSLVVPAEETLDRALELASRVAAMPPLAVRSAKAMVNAAQELPLGEGLRLERRVFFDLFATEDQHEGMTAFIEKRPPRWTGR